MSTCAGPRIYVVKSVCVCQMVTIINIKTLLVFVETTRFVF